MSLFEGGYDLTKLDEAEIANLGVGRKFQKPTVFENHTVSDNMLLATKGAPRAASTTTLFAAGGQPRTPSSRILVTTRLAEVRARVAGFAVARPEAVARDRHAARPGPKLLLVDEPVAGMTDAETAATAQFFSEIAHDHSVVVVEHDMAFVRELGVKVTVLHEGSVLAEGRWIRSAPTRASSKSIWVEERHVGSLCPSPALERQVFPSPSAGNGAKRPDRVWPAA